MIILINGALGSGKTSLGEALASSCCIPSSRGRENDQQQTTKENEDAGRSRSVSRNIMEGCAVIDVDHLVNFHQHKENQGNRGSCCTSILLFIQ